VIVSTFDSGSVADILRYDSELVSGTLTAGNMEKNVIPRIRKTLEEYGKTDEDGDSKCVFFFAQSDRCFMVSRDFCCTQVFFPADAGPTFSLVTSYCERHPEEETEERIRNGFRMAARHHYDFFPLWMIDTVTQKVVLLKS